PVNLAAPGAALRDVAGQRNDTRRKVGTLSIRNALSKRGGPRVAVGGYVSRIHSQRVPATQRARERNRIEVDAETRTNHRLLSQAICESNARSEQFVADRDSRVIGNIAASAEEHVIGVRIVTLDALARACHQREELIAQAEVDREVPVDLPAILRVPAKLPF